MQLITVKCPDATGVGAGQTAVFTLPIGRTYHNLTLAYSGVTLAQIDAVRLKINGQIVMELGSGNDIDARNKFDGLEAAAGLLFINFERESLHDAVMRMATTIGTGFVHVGPDAYKNAFEAKNMSLEVDINAAAVGTVISLKAQQSSPKPLGMLRRMDKVSKSLASGETFIADFARNLTTKRSINRMFFKSANMTALRIEKDNFRVFERTKAENERYQLNGWRVPQSGWVNFDPSENALGTNVLDVFDAQDFQVIPTASGAETVTVYIEYLGVL